MAILLSIACILFAILLLSLSKLGRVYYKARLIGFPVVVSPIDHSSRIWRLLGDRITPLLKYLPFRLGRFIGFGHFFHDRYSMHERLGPIYTVAAPGGITIVVADAETAEDVLARRKEFIKRRSMFKPLELFGPNVDTLNGEAWQRHRRLTTPPFNERNSSLVWRESITQAKGMIKSWVSTGREGVSKTTSDTMTLALHVLTAAGFGTTYDFEGGVTKLSGDHKMSYKNALRMILGNIFVSYLVKSNQAPAYIPKSTVTEVGTALTEFQQYMEDMIDEEKAKIGTSMANDNLMSVLVHASESEGRGDDRGGLTKEEMLGNLFIYNLAGHDTTANTIGYAVYLMASDSKWQAWIREELDVVFSGQTDLGEDDYEIAFPKLKRCLAVMYETLRLYGPVVIIPKTTGAKTATAIDFVRRTYIIPSNTTILVSMTALNSSPHYWGPDALTWRPDRWITNKGDCTGLDTEEMMQPPKGRFLPWASGPRVCPGKKFSQVEFVAVMARLFRQHFVMPVVNEGESEDDVKRRVLETVEDSKLVMTLRMNNPERVKLIWEER
ncbi:cytochrome P450, family 5, subfamily A [Rhexocercosporidium sp. MPI-PUGE-AT-0058]|nr:cytochrome P450, family 5, subfamily A [Rhexocercosporidium sp. MPI-PUGE-AT-0058]